MLYLSYYTHTFAPENEKYNVNVMNKTKIFSGLLISSMLVACNSQNEEKKADAVSVETDIVTKDNSNASTATYVGEIEAESSTAVSFAGNGTILKVLVSEGQHVNKGQLIAVMDDTHSRSSYEGAQAAMTQAQDAYDRMKVLHDRQSLSEMDWVQVQTGLQQAKSNLQKMKKGLDDCRLLAPCSGVIGSKRMESGEMAMSGQAVCSILDISKVKVKISVPEKEVMNIAPEAKIMVGALEDEPFSSIGMERGVTADAVSRTYEVRYLVNNKDGILLPGMVCNVVPNSSNKDESKSITLPITSVQRGADGQMFVWTIRNGEAHRSKVWGGKASGNRMSILDGVKEGDKVVIKGYQKLYENCKVK